MTPPPKCLAHPELILQRKTCWNVTIFYNFYNVDWLRTVGASTNMPKILNWLYRDTCRNVTIFCDFSCYKYWKINFKGTTDSSTEICKKQRLFYARPIRNNSPSLQQPIIHIDISSQSNYGKPNCKTKTRPILPNGSRWSFGNDVGNDKGWATLCNCVQKFLKFLTN